MVRNMPEKLRNARKKLGLKQEDVTAATGVTVSMLSKYENGSAVPPCEVLAKLTAFYHTSADFLLDIKPGRYINVTKLTQEEEADVQKIVNHIAKDG